MGKAAEALEKAAVTLEKYRKNKTLVLPEELAGKYKKPFEKLKQQLKEELEAYLKAYILDGLKIRDDDEGRQVIADIGQSFKEARIGRQVSRAAFREFDLEKIKRIARGHRRKVEEIYKAYFDRHTCLYAIGYQAMDNPQPPLIYNDIVDRFYDGTAERWISKEKPPGAAILIFISEKPEGRKEK